MCLPSACSQRERSSILKTRLSESGESLHRWRSFTEINYLAACDVSRNVSSCRPFSSLLGALCKMLFPGSLVIQTTKERFLTL